MIDDLRRGGGSLLKQWSLQARVSCLTLRSVRDHRRAAVGLISPIGSFVNMREERGHVT